jgi:hypothetical protein
MEVLTAGGLEDRLEAQSAIRSMKICPTRITTPRNHTESVNYIFVGVKPYFYRDYSIASFAEW